MIKIKTFSYDEAEKLNKFIIENPPINTKDGSGIILRDNFMVVLYEDGTFNEKAQHNASVNFAIGTAKQNVINKSIEAQTLAAELDKLIQKEHYKDKSDSDVTGYFQKNGLNYKQAGEMVKLVRELEQKVWLAEKEIHQQGVVIPALEALIK